jgi:hypothetical protein
VFRFSSWLRKTYPGSYGIRKGLARKKNGRSLRLEALEERVVPDSGGAANPNLLNGNLIYNGSGPVLANVQIEPIFIDDGSGISFQTELHSFLSKISSDGYIPQLLSQYNITGFNIGNGSVGTDDVAFYNPDTTDTGLPAFSDGFIQNIVGSEINLGNTAPVTANTLYFVFTPPDSAVTTSFGDSLTGFLGYHSNFTLGSNNVYYAVVPDETSNVVGNGNQDFLGLSRFQSETAVSSHELSEAITDPTPNTEWTDNTYGEVGDMAAGNVYTQDGFAAQYEWSQQALGIAHAQASAGDQNTLFINQLLPPAVDTVSTITPFPVGTFTDTNSTLTAADFSATVDFGDGFGPQTATITGGAGGVYTVSANPVLNLADGQYGAPFNQQSGMIVEVIDTLDGGFPLANRFVPYTVSPSAPFIYNADNGGAAHDLRLVGNNLTGNYELYDSGQLVFTQPINQTTAFNIGADPGVDASLTIDFSGGSLGSLPITFDGGTGAGTHTLTIENSFVTNAEYSYTDANSGLITLNGQTISFTHTSSIADNDVNINEIFNLPTGAHALLQDDGTSGNGISEITSLNSTSVTTTFSNPTTSLTINTAGTSVVQLAAMDSNFAPTLEDFSGQATDVFSFASSGAVPSGTNLDLSLATLDLNGFSPTINALGGDGTISDGSTFTNSTLTVGASGGTGDFTGVIQNGSGSVGLTVNGTGASETLGGANTYSGATTIASGTLVVGAANTIPSASDVTDNGTLDLGGFSDTIGALDGSGTVLSSTSGSATLTVGGDGGIGSFSGSIEDGSGTVSLTVDGAGSSETLSGTNTYSGTTTITSGTLVLGNTNTISSSSNVTDDSTLDLGGFSDTIGALDGNGIVTNDGLGGATLTVGGNGATGTFSGSIENGLGQVGLTVDGTGASETLSGTNTYSGATTITSGTLVAGATSSLSSNSDVTDNSTLDLHGFGTTIGALDGSGTVDSSVSGVVTLTVGNTGNNGSFSGVISNGSGVVLLAKVGTGNETITGTSNSYSGATLVIAGTLEVDGSIASNVTVAGTGTLTGTGTVQGVTTSGGALAPISLTSDGLVLHAGSSFNATIGGNTTGHYSQDTVASGTVTIETTGAGVALDVAAAFYTPQAGDVYVLINNNGGSAINGTFVAGLGIDLPLGTPLTEGTILSANFLGSGLSAKITYTAGSGHDSAAIMLQKDLTVSIGAPSLPITAHGPVTFTVTYTDVDSDFISSSLTTSNVHLITTGTATGTLSFDSGSGATRTVTIGNISGDGTLGISIDAGSAIDGHGNLPDASGPSGTFIVDNTPPSVTISAPSKNITASSSVTYTVTYADANFGSSSLIPANIALNVTGTANGTVSVSGSGLSYTVTISGITGDGTLGISIAAGTAVDQAGNLAGTAGPSSTFIVDNTPPSVTISAPSKNITASSSVSYTVTYADANFGSSSLVAGDITLNETGSATGTIGVSGSGLVYTVTVSGITGDGTLGISIAANTAVDQAGNEAPAAGPSATFIVDNTAPTVTISAPSQSITASSSVTYTVTYADAHFASSSLTTADITLNKTGTASGSVLVSGSGLSYTVTISGITGDGTLAISIAANTAVDQAGNEAPAAGPSGTFIVDNTPPSVTISAPSKNITASSSVTYTVTYADANFGSSSLTTADITLNTTGTATGTIGLSGSGTSYTVTISSITGDGSLGISIAAGTAIDQAGNTAGAAGPSGTFIVDNTPPTVSIGAPSNSITASSSVTYTVTYADANFGSSSLVASDVTLNTTGTANGTIGVTGSGLSYTVTISGITGDGSLGISIAANTAVDQAGNEAPAAGPSGTFIVDNTPPSVTIGAPSKDITASSSVTYSVTYADANFGSSSLVAGDVTLNKTGTANGTIGVTGSGLSYMVTISGITGDGSLGISIVAGTAVDQAGNTAAAAGPSGTFIVDNTPPSVTISAPSKNITAGSSVTYTVTYADAHFASSSLTTADITLNKTGTANGTIGLTGSGLSYTVTLSSITGDGSLGISIAAGTAVDQAGNTAGASGPSGTFIVDNTPPTVSIGAPSKNITASSSVTYSVTYADANFGSSSLSTADITLNETGTANGTLAVSGSGTSYTVTISSITGDGSLGISIAAGTAIDQAGNTAGAAGPSGTFIVDNTPPTVTIGAPSASITASSSVTYTVSYADANFGSSSLVASDITLNKTGTANGTVGVSGSGTSYTVTVSGITGDGSLGISIAAGTAVDQAGNTAGATGPSGTFIVDNTPPTVTIGVPSASITASSSVTYTVTYADAHFASSSLTTADITLNKTGTADGTVGVSGSGTSYVVTISGISGDGSLGISIAAGTAVDQAGNTAPASGPSGTFIVDNTPPSVTISAPSKTVTSFSTVNYTVSYADANFGSSNLTTSDITLNKTGTANGVVSLSGSGLSYTVSISNITGDGSLGISIAANTAVDQAGNKAAAAGPSSTVLVDNTPPTSTVAALPQYSTGSFTVSWSGSDNPGGSGLASFTIYVIDNGGPATPIATNTTATSLVYSNVVNGHTYGFFSIATDNAGNTQPAPSTPQASTTVDTVAPTSGVNPLPANSLPSFTVSWSGQDNAGGSGLKYFDVYSNVDGGAFTVWQSHTTATSAVFSGGLDHTYGFYTVATDNAGNVESKTPHAEATTQTPVFQTTISEAENITAPTPEKISALLGTHYGDVDKNTKQGIAVTFLSGSGTWQYSANGTTWTNIGSISVSNALLLPSKDSLRFVPAANWHGEADLLFLAWDGSVGTAGGHANTSSPGGASAFSTTGGEFSVTVLSAAHAPSWTATTITLTPVLPGATTNNGETVQQAFGGLFADPTFTLAPSIAITGVTGTTSGTWQYQLASGGGFQNFPKISATTALLLGPNDLIRFVPKSSTFTGSVSLTVRAWDGSGGFSDGQQGVNVTKAGTGGIKPFSSNTLTAKLYFNDAPVQNPPTGGISLGISAENTASKPVSVTTLVKTDAHGTDADKGTSLGMAVTGASGPGTWQYMLPGGTWHSVPATVSSGSALLLPATAMVRFLPTTNQSGTANLTWVAWDGTQGTAGAQGFVITATGGATAFSSTPAGATLTITSSAHAPAFSPTSGARLTPVLPGNANPAGDTISSVFGGFFQDPNATAVGIAISGISGTKNGQWQYSTDGGTTWLNLTGVSAKQARLLSGTDRIRFVPNAGFVGTVSLTAHAWDGAGFTDGSTANLTLKGTTGGTSHIGSGTMTASCAVNTAPTLS